MPASEMLFRHQAPVFLGAFLCTATLLPGGQAAPDRAVSLSKAAPLPPRALAPHPPQHSVELPRENRSIDGSGNNLAHPHWGRADEPYLRLVPAAYADGHASPAGGDRPGAREVSNVLAAQSGSQLNRRGATDFIWQWGQFLDHDIDETPTVDPPEPFDITVPTGDPSFDPGGTGTALIPFNRSSYNMVDGVREQVNVITAWIDASNVYGSDEERAAALRTLDGTGRLRTTASVHGDLLPYNTPGLPNAMSNSPAFFLAGDVRANEQIGLTAMHTLFVREHNHWADRYAELNPEADGEEIYQFARSLVAAEMQAITYNEFLPVLLGRYSLPRYRGYRPEVNATVSNLFAGAAYRMGHSMLSPTLLRLDRKGRAIPAGHLPLAKAFFQPAETENHGIDPTLRGLARQTCQELDGRVVDDVRNMLFGSPGSGGFDLAALNIQRGRDHGLPGFVETCRALGLPPASHFRDINPDPAVWQPMQALYGDVTLVDCWIGGLCEPHARGALVGPMLKKVLTDQFTRLRDGDRFFYRHHLPRPLVRLVERQTLARIIRRNTGIAHEIQDNVFLRPVRRPRRSWWRSWRP